MEIRQDEMGAVEMRGVGTGFCRVSRTVFEKIIAAHPELKRPGLESQTEEEQANFYRFFTFLDDEHGNMMSEDLYFCQMARELGFTTWADPVIELVHVGEQEFTGTFACLLTPVEE